MWCKFQVYHAPLCSISEKNSCGVRTLNTLIIFVEWFSLSCSIYTKYISILKTGERAIFELWFKVHVCHAPLCSIIQKKGCGVPTLKRIIISRTDRALVGIYMLNMYLFWQQRSVLYLNFGIRFKLVMCQCNCACWYASYPDTDILRHRSGGIEALSAQKRRMIVWVSYF